MHVQIDWNYGKLNENYGQSMNTLGKSMKTMEKPTKTMEKWMNSANGKFELKSSARYSFLLQDSKEKCPDWEKID